MEKFKTKEIAVVKMNLASSKLEPKQVYQVDFEARIDGEGGLIAKLPSVPTGLVPEKQESNFSPLMHHYAPRRYTFKYDPASNEGEVTFVFPKEMIEKAPVVYFRNFRIRKSE